MPNDPNSDMKMSDPNINQSTRDQSMSHYSTPDGYFLDFAERMKQRIEQEEQHIEVPVETTARKPLLRSLRPVLYLAASFLLTIGLYQTYNKFAVPETAPLSNTQSFVSVYDDSNEDSDYLSFIKESSSDVLSNEWVLTDYYE